MSVTGTVCEFTNEQAEFLLGRPICADLSVDVRARLRGQRVLITGAGGSIGSALAREIATCRPRVIGLFEQSELALFEIERTLRRVAPDVDLEPVMADVTRRPDVRQACRRIRPDVTYHAAACKHVTMAERAPSVAAHVNVVGTANVAGAARAVGGRFVLISSDKAADPRSVMGATKRLAERVTLGMATPGFRPIVVRFGNVLGSSGSVVQVMRDAIRSSRPLPITDLAATRYFMTAREAVGLVLRADLLAARRETFWLDMGDPIRLGDLVDRLLALEADAGFPPVPVELIGLRPGEKLNEVLADPSLRFERTIDERIRVARDVAGGRAEVREAVRRLRQAGARADSRLALATLARTVDGFVPSELAVAAAASARPEDAGPGRSSRSHRAA